MLDFLWFSYLSIICSWEISFLFFRTVLDFTLALEYFISATTFISNSWLSFSECSFLSILTLYNPGCYCSKNRERELGSGFSPFRMPAFPESPCCPSASPPSLPAEANISSSTSSGFQLVLFSAPNFSHCYGSGRSLILLKITVLTWKKLWFCLIALLRGQVL